MNERIMKEASEKFDAEKFSTLKALFSQGGFTAALLKWMTAVTVHGIMAHVSHNKIRNITFQPQCDQSS